MLGSQRQYADGIRGKDLPMKNSTSGLLLLSLGVAMASGCGGNSTAFTNDVGGSAGKAGSGGSGGSAGSAGATVGGAGGGTGGSSGGKGGGAGSGTGGSGVAGEGASSGSGGGPAAGSGGMGGTGGMTGYRPPASQVDGCTLMCEAAVEAMCENDNSLEQCESECGFAIRLEACSDQWDDFFACTNDSEPECNAEGATAWPECVAEYAAVIDCAYNDAMDPDLEAPCEASCEAQSSVTCDNSTGTADCTNECGLFGAVIPVCKAQYLAYLACARDADFTCDAEGNPQPEGCNMTAVPLLVCVTNEYDITF
jgi:hypothetical protein